LFVIVVAPTLSSSVRSHSLQAQAAHARANVILPPPPPLNELRSTPLIFSFFLLPLPSPSLMMLKLGSL
jgi:hypothetical protein